MSISYEDDEIVFIIDSETGSAAFERAYLRQFDGATVEFVQSNEEDKLVGEGDKLVIKKHE